MAIEFTNDKVTALDTSAGLRDQVFNPAQNAVDKAISPLAGDKAPAVATDNTSANVGDKANMAGSDNFTRAELLERNAALIAEVNKTAERLATAAVKTLQGVPAHLQDAFFDGISVYTDRHDVVYQAMREQWAATQTA